MIDQHHTIYFKHRRPLLKTFLPLCISAALAMSAWMFLHPRKSHQSATDFVIQRDLAIRLHSLSHSPLRITVASGSVKLEGRVETSYDHDEILAVAREGAGTNHVIDDLAVKRAGVQAQNTGDRYGAWLRAQRFDSSIATESGRTHSGAGESGE